MKITILCVGKIKEKFFRDATEEYVKRLSRYCRLEILEVADEKTPDGAGELIEEQIKLKEAERILKLLKEDAYIYSLEIGGENPDSETLSNQIEQLGIQGKSHIQFIIGGSLGLHSRISKAADKNLSFSRLTFPHQLMRVILLEQLYRSFRIISGEPYHK